MPRRSNCQSSSGLRKLPARRRLARFEQLEPRLVLSAAGPIGDTPYIDLGTSDNVAWDQPRVTVELLTDAAGTGVVGPDFFKTWLLDTGANSVMAFATPVGEMKQGPHVYQTEGVFDELGVGGTHEFDISAPYRFDFAGFCRDSLQEICGQRNTLLNTRILSDSENDLSILGPWGIVGMPAMADRVTTFDFSGWTNVSLDTFFMEVFFADTLPADNGHRVSISVDNRVSFQPEGQVREGLHPPVWADIPFLTGHLMHNGLVAEGNLLFDTGAQISVLSSNLAKQLGLDSNHDGVLDEHDANFARYEVVGGVGGTRAAPVFLFDEVHVPTQQGPDLVWTELQWLVIDIIDGIDGVFGFDHMTSGWIEAFAVDGQSGYTMQSHLDFRDWRTTGQGTIHFDLNPEVHQVIDPLGPGANVIETGRWTTVSESGISDSYQISLSQPPTHDVTVQLANSDGQLSAVDATDTSRDYLVFTPANWDTPQTVLVRAVDDNLVENFHRSSIRHVSSSADPAYHGIGMPRVIVNIIDDDFAGLMLIPSAGATEVVEGGATDTYQVVLTKPPSQTVTVDLEHVSNQVTALSASTGSGFLVFTPSNWSTPQTVVVTAIDDDDLEGDHSTYITHSLDSSDPEYLQAFPLQEYVAIGENDTADFGDAPPPYPTRLGRDGARHLTSSLRLGSHFDQEIDGQPHATAHGDDLVGGADDEDGITLPAVLQPGQTAAVSVEASGPGLVNAWIDFNADGDWDDTGEHIFINVPVTAGDNELSFTVPGAAQVTAQTFARFRLSTQSGIAATGLALDGEVEDYAVAIGVAVVTPPQVEGVYLRGQSWQDPFLDHLDALQYGHTSVERLGYGPVAGSGTQLATLPWSNIDQVTIRFTEDVQVAADDLAVVGVNAASYSTTGFSYDDATYTATWTFAQPLPTDKVLLVLHSDAAEGVASRGGVPLDGQWNNPADSSDLSSDVFPSGDGVAGGDFHFRFNVLPGDANQSAGVGVDDIGPLRNALLKSVGDSAYNYLADFNGSGGNGVDDIGPLRNNLLARLPDGEPPAPQAPSASPGVALVALADVGRLRTIPRRPHDVCFPVTRLPASSLERTYLLAQPHQRSAASAADQTFSRMTAHWMDVQRHGELPLNSAAHRPLNGPSMTASRRPATEASSTLPRADQFGVIEQLVSASQELSVSHSRHSATAAVLEDRAWQEGEMLDQPALVDDDLLQELADDSLRQ